jgi:hypothetical protein
VGVVATLVAAIALAAATPAAFLERHQDAAGGWSGDPSLSAWAALGLAASGVGGDALERARAFLAAHEDEARSDTDIALQVVARCALGDCPERLVERLAAHVPGQLVNATAWAIIGLRAAGREPPPGLVRALLAAQHRSGGFSWSRGGQPDSNDTAAAIQALRAAGVGGKPIARALAYLARCRTREGGFAIAPGRAADAQSTAWAIQAYLAAGRRPPQSAFRFLASLRRPDGSYRYSRAYATTPVWVTAQVLPALARKPLPLRAPVSAGS